MNAPLPPVDRYVYLLGDLPFLILWLGVYCCRKDLRRPLWIMSLFTTAGSLTGPFFREDYFHPRRIWDLDGLGLEDVIFCFLITIFLQPCLFYGHGRKPIEKMEVSAWPSIGFNSRKA
jgi:hypothetical protein